jgi:hypothetical protein
MGKVGERPLHGRGRLEVQEIFPRVQVRQLLERSCAQVVYRSYAPVRYAASLLAVGRTNHYANRKLLVVVQVISIRDRMGRTGRAIRKGGFVYGRYWARTETLACPVVVGTAWF